MTWADQSRARLLFLSFFIDEIGVEISPKTFFTYRFSL
jgi:hypothetical protein